MSLTFALSSWSEFWLLGFCNFDKTPTPPILVFEALILTAAIACGLFWPKLQSKIWQRALIMATGVLIFELFTAPMWHNYRLGFWAYLYQDVSWVLTVGWTCLILSVVLLTDHYLKQWKEGQRFGLYLAILTVLVMPLEATVVNIGIRSYAQEVIDNFVGVFVWNVPIEALYYTPVFTGLVISFYKYWSFVLDDEPLAPLKKRKWLRSFGLTLLAVFLFEVMIQPIVSNQNFPRWSYLVYDISWLMTGMWVLIIGLAAAIVGRFFPHWPTPLRFAIAIGLTSAIALPLESWLVLSGYRVYGPSAEHNFSGFLTPITNLPVEIAFAIPFYMALIIAFIRYWETVLDNRL